jgi:Protein of unknown function (DUF2924)
LLYVLGGSSRGQRLSSLRRDFLIRAVAYQLQVKAFGGLSAATKRKLREIAAAAREGRFDPALIGPRVKPGTRLIRVWRGETHTVHVLEDGFEWNGSRYGSLSVIAKAISGTNWNGWVFFGVKRRPARNKNASLEVRRAKAQRASAAQSQEELANA